MWHFRMVYKVVWKTNSQTIASNNFFQISNEPFKHLQTATPEVGDATFKPTISPISRGDTLPPADNALTNFGINALYFLQIPFIERVHEHLGVDVGVIIEAVVCHIIVGFHGPFSFQFWEPRDGVAEDAIAALSPMATNRFVIQILTILYGGVECLFKPNPRRHLERCHPRLIQNQSTTTLFVQHPILHYPATGQLAAVRQKLTPSLQQ